MTEAPPELVAAVAEMTATWGLSDGEQAWPFLSERCQAGYEESAAGYDDGVGYEGGVAAYFQDGVAGWARRYPVATADNITGVVDGDRAAMTYDVFDGSGAFAENYTAQPWEFSDGNWHQDHC